MQINATISELVDELYEVLDEIGNIPHPMADELYHNLNQYLLSIVEENN